MQKQRIKDRGIYSGWYSLSWALKLAADAQQVGAVSRECAVDGLDGGERSRTGKNVELTVRRLSLQCGMNMAGAAKSAVVGSTERLERNEGSTIRVEANLALDGM